MATTAAQIGIFFDGTGNNKELDIPDNCESNIAKLYSLYNTAPYTFENSTEIEFIRKLYIRGVGSKSGERVFGGVNGIGARRRLTRAYNFVKQHFDADDALSCDLKYVDIFGFSRGAAMARHFANMLLNMPPNIGDSDATHTIVIRFLGIFDTVASFGMPGNEIDLGFDLHVDPTKVERCVHFTADHERRSFFDLQSILSSANATQADNCTELGYPGAHSDVGGGYMLIPERAAGFYKKRIIKGKYVDVPADDDFFEADEYLPDDVVFDQEENIDEDYYLGEQLGKSNELCRIPLKDMYDEITDFGIRMNNMADDPRYAISMKISDEVKSFYQDYRDNGLSFKDAIQTRYIHDSRYIIDDISEKFPWNDLKREIYYTQPDNIVWQHEKEIAAGEWDDYDEENV